MSRRVFPVAWAIIAAITLATVTVNALTALEDFDGLDWWEPWVWEASSGAVILALAWIPALAVRGAPPEGRWLRFVGVHAGALLIFSVIHVAAFLVLRQAAYAWLGVQYRSGPFTEIFPYELRKDALSYAALAVTFWLTARLMRRSAHPAEAPATFDIQDGARLIRTPLADILAVTSAGNYVEFQLADGRRPLMRATLVSLEDDLASRGFVRSHRSWLVNRSRVTGLIPDGSGDWTVELGPISAPLSRRYRQALAEIKG